MKETIIYYLAKASTKPSEQVSNVDGGKTDLQVTVKNILNVVFAMVGIIAVIMVIVGGVNFMTSQGDPEKIKRAKNTILYGVIGLIITLLAFAIVSFVLKGMNGA